MAKYGNFLYGTNKYGVTPKLAYSVEPMSSTVVLFNEVYVDWQSPIGNFTKIRLVRNQNGFPQNSEDGVIIWEENATEGTVSRSSFRDGEDNPGSIPIASGRQIYYSMWLFTDEKVWVNAGEVNDIVPFDHNTQKKLIDSIPRVYTTFEQSPLGTVNYDSDLAKFLDGFAFTYEQLLTYADLLLPQVDKDLSPFALLRNETIAVGLELEPSIPVKNQKRLVREALYMYKHKGLHSGLSTYVESLTGYAPTITTSTNLILTFQDSTFFKTTGNWSATNATISSSTEQVPVTGDLVIDTTDSCKIVASGSGVMSNGTANPITRGIPVNAETDYVLSLKLKSPASAGNINATIKWFDKNGTYISSSTATAVAANNTWKSLEYTATSPALAVYASLEISYSAAGTYYVDQVCFQEGTTAAYDEARAIDIYVAPDKTNFILNPSFEVDTANWVATDATLTRQEDVSADAYVGTYSAQVEGTDWVVSTPALTAEDGLILGQYYTFSIFVKADAEFTLSLSHDISSVSETFPATNGEWGRYSVQHLVPANGGEVVASISSAETTSEFYIDCAQLEKSIRPTEYFDGSLPANYGTVWGGTPNASFSYLYYNKDTKIFRLADTLHSWVPMNSFWRIRSIEGVEYTRNEV